MVKFSNALGLDIGEKRVGVARVNSVAKIPEPLFTINTEEFDSLIGSIISEHVIDLIVVGLPRNMSGEETAQTQIIREFIDTHITPNTTLPVILQDETLTTVGAEESYQKDKIIKYGIDALAASEILRDYVEQL